jgi:hypothetical protein
VIALALVDRLEDLEFRRVLNHASGVARCELDVLNNFVYVIVRVDFAERGTGDEFISSDRAEGRAAIRRHSAGDRDIRGSCVRRR